MATCSIIDPASSCLGPRKRRRQPEHQSYHRARTTIRCVLWLGQPEDVVIAKERPRPHPRDRTTAAGPWATGRPAGLAAPPGRRRHVNGLKPAWHRMYRTLERRRPNRISLAPNGVHHETRLTPTHRPTWSRLRHSACTRFDAKEHTHSPQQGHHRAACQQTVHGMGPLHIRSTRRTVSREDHRADLADHRVPARSRILALGAAPAAGGNKTAPRRHARGTRNSVRSWKEFYFQPLRAYFGNETSTKGSAARPTKRKCGRAQGRAR